MKNKKGFTLIEILVVVLIIGVLGSLALPQYLKSVEKSKYAEAEEILQTIYTAQHRYVLDNNTYAETFDDLDITFEDVDMSKAINGSVYTTNNFRISLDRANSIVPIVIADRVKASGGNDSTIYAIYKNLATGDTMCEDIDTKDNITCNLFGFDGSVKACSDGHIIGPNEKCKTSFGDKELCLFKPNCEWVGLKCVCKAVLVDEDELITLCKKRGCKWDLKNRKCNCEEARVPVNKEKEPIFKEQKP